jgi:hypothetical protein
VVDIESALDDATWHELEGADQIVTPRYPEGLVSCNGYIKGTVGQTGVKRTGH